VALEGVIRLVSTGSVGPCATALLEDVSGVVELEWSCLLLVGLLR
jgi:hypothetical protein